MFSISPFVFLHLLGQGISVSRQSFSLCFSSSGRINASLHPSHSTILNTHIFSCSSISFLCIFLLHFSLGHCTRWKVQVSLCFASFSSCPVQSHLCSKLCASDGIAINYLISSSLYVLFLVRVIVSYNNNNNNNNNNIYL
jgi:hypothetical protein